MDTKKLQKVEALVSEALTLLEEVRDAEQERFDGKSEAWQESEAGQDAASRLDELNEARDALEQFDLGNVI